MSGKIVNLRSVRKARARDDVRASADANAAKFGRTKEQKTLEDARAAKARRILDDHKRD